MIIGITTRVQKITYGEKYELRDGLAHDWCNLFESINVTPILIPNGLTHTLDYVKKLGVERLILSGGEDLGKLEQKNLETEPTIRDKVELNLLSWALSDNIPVLGVCRGMQIINIFFGGKITRKLEEMVPDENHSGKAHKIRFINNYLSGKEFTVNSYHNQGIVQEDLAAQLEMIAHTKGGVVEALRHREKSLIGIQWHPERNKCISEVDQHIIKLWMENK